MTETDTSLPVLPGVASGPLAWRLAKSLFLFSSALCALLALSAFFILPRWTTLRVSGTLLQPQEVAAYEEHVQLKLTEAEAAREELLLPRYVEAYGQLKDYAFSQLPFATLHAEILRAASMIVAEDETIAINHFEFSPARATLIVSGEVRTQSPSSMTVLAQFTDAFGALPFVSSFERPAFTREELSSGGFRSPFHIVLTLSSPADASSL